MKKVIVLTILTTMLGLMAFVSHEVAPDREDWGFFGHRRINRMAVFTLPPEMIVFYKKHIEYITEHAVDPDKRRYISQQEAPRHYIDIDHYGEAPFPELPRRWLDALAKYTQVFITTPDQDTLQLLGHEVMRFAADSITLYGEAVNRIWAQDSVRLSTRRYVDWVYHNIEAQFYELDWKVSLDSLDTLFEMERLAGAYSSAYAHDYLSDYGIVPWHLEKMLRRLSYAMRDGDKDKILRYTSDIGHYIGDAHVPLHTTLNYNGQLTDQVGIHGFWESRLPELFADGYDYFVGKAQYITDPNAYFFDIVLASHAHLDSVLIIERELTETFGSDRKYCYETRGEKTIRTYCTDFSDAYHRRLDGMVERRLRASIHSIGSAWYTAWVNAGQPDLNKLLDEGDDVQQLMEEARKELEGIAGQKIKGRAHDN